MKTFNALLAFTLITTGLVCLDGCKQEPSPTSTAPTAAPAIKPDQHAAAAAKPGSHEDWCDEHQVPESQCTRCNPKLIAAFKATGDWCGEHNVPESQCLKCNPDLKIQRPPKVESTP